MYTPDTWLLAQLIPLEVKQAVSLRSCVLSLVLELNLKKLKGPSKRTISAFAFWTNFVGSTGLEPSECIEWHLKRYIFPTSIWFWDPSQPNKKNKKANSSHKQFLTTESFPLLEKWIPFPSIRIFLWKSGNPHFRYPFIIKYILQEFLFMF